MEQLVNHYEIKHKLGEGSFSTVFLGKHRKNKSAFAVKHINKVKASVENYENEVKVMKAIKKSPHKNIVCLKEVFEDDDDLFLVEELVSCGDLLAHITKNKATMKEEDAKRLFFSVLLAVEHLHRLGIAHRDIKLENVMLTEKEEVKMVDFNLSSFFTRDALLTKYCGSVFYCAPEILRRTPYNGEKVDIWSLGVLLYVLLFFKFPFDITRKDEEPERKDIVKRKILKGKFVFPEKGSISAEAKSLINWILVEDPNMRPTASMIKQHPYFSSLREKETKRVFLFDVPKLVRSHSSLRNSSPSVPVYNPVSSPAPTPATSHLPQTASPIEESNGDGSPMDFESSDSSSDESSDDSGRRGYSVHQIPVIPRELTEVPTPMMKEEEAQQQAEPKAKNFLFKTLVN
eukprot:TRINITY_DN3620_c0_g1_i1.p1 TRINITY_DN3620_c0_g1~~TRINITY_DN3620_c0_g1_i1.p1  ORF type:complete len:402 (-),score=111.05 TRINITY_DN3620_c0_g1_i1:234-1439(-)